MYLPTYLNLLPTYMYTCNCLLRIGSSYNIHLNFNLWPGGEMRWRSSQVSTWNLEYIKGMTSTLAFISHSFSSLIALVPTTKTHDSSHPPTITLYLCHGRIICMYPWYSEKWNPSKHSFRHFSILWSNEWNVQLPVKRIIPNHMVLLLKQLPTQLKPC